MAATKIEASQGAFTLNEVRSLLGHEEIDRPVGDQLLFEAGGQPGGITASIESAIAEETQQAKDEITSHARVERYLNHPERSDQS